MRRMRYKLNRFLSIQPEDEVSEPVAKLFKHNFTVNFLDNAIWMFGDSFHSAATILPVFVSTLTESPIIIGLIPAILNAGWVLPQLFMASKAQHKAKVFPLARKLAISERIPYLFIPFLALLINRIPNQLVLWLFLFFITWRGIASGLVALPWQMVIGAVIPISHRSRFFGSSRVVGQIMGVVASAISALILDRVRYPLNYALCFFLAFFFLCASLIFFLMTKIPPSESAEEEVALPDPVQTNNWAAYKAILKADANFRSYLLSRAFYFFSIMATGFLAVYGIQKFSLSEGQAAVFTGLFFASGVVGNAIWGALGDRIGPKRIVLFSTFLWIVGLLIAIFAPTHWLYYLVFVLYGSSSAGFILGDLVLVMELGKEEQMASYMGLGRTLPGIFLLIAPVFAGWLVGITSYPVMFWLAIGFSVLNLLFVLKVKDRPRTRHAS